VMMSILIAGRVGSAMAAEIGSMRVYQEIDALRTMNISPVHYLVLPRSIAIAMALPLLVQIGELMGRMKRARSRRSLSRFATFR
jgi:phospholipid/cholesterol/gamma-HCH transport system permease protein